MSIPFRAVVQGIGRDGSPFAETTVLDNLSSGGLYLRLTTEVIGGSRLMVNVSMSSRQGGEDGDGLILEVYGPVERLDRLLGGGFGIAISFTSSVLV